MTRLPVSFFVPCTPRGKERARVVHAHGRTFAYTPKATKNLEACIARSAKEAFAGLPPFDGAVRLTVDVFFDYPASWSSAKRACNRLKITKPDLDNCLKAVSDALNGIAYKDDSQVASLNGVKAYIPTGIQAGFEVLIEECD